MSEDLTIGYHARKRAFVRELLENYMTAKRDGTVKGHYNRIAPGKDGKIHTEPNPIGTSTGRFSSSAYDMGDESSTNLQNLNKRVAEIDPLYALRDCIVPDPGFLLWAADYSGAEALLAAAYQQDWEMYDMLLSGRNVHSWHASIVFGIPEEGVKKNHKLEYSIAKNLGYGGQYYASVWKLTQTLNAMAEQFGRRFSQDEVAGYRLEFMQIHPWEKWWHDVRMELRDNDSATRNCFGFRRQFFYPDEDKRLKEALANYPQSTVASLISEAMLDVDALLDTPRRFEVLLQVHDEIMGQVRDDLVNDYLPKVKEIMERPFKIHGREIYIPAEVCVGTDWGHMEDV